MCNGDSFTFFVFKPLCFCMTSTRMLRVRLLLFYTLFSFPSTGDFSAGHRHTAITTAISDEGSNSGWLDRDLASDLSSGFQLSRSERCALSGGGLRVSVVL